MTAKKVVPEKPGSCVVVIDTSVLLYSATSLFSFGKCDVVLPISVLDELDKFKPNMDEQGRNARQVIRYLHELRQLGNLRDGVKLESGSRLYAVIEESLDPLFLVNNADNRILSVCKSLLSSGKYSTVTLVSKDVNLTVKADAIGVEATDYIEESKIKQAEDLYTGIITLDVSQEVIDDIYKSRAIQFNTAYMYPNQFVVLRNEINPKQTAVGRVSSDGCGIKLLPKKISAWGMEHRSVQQLCALDLLMDDTVPLVTMTGRAGVGKTMLSIAAGLEKVVEEHRYENVVIMRPTIPLGKQHDLGFLPGNIAEKYKIWLMPFVDQLSVLSGNSNTLKEDAFEMFVSTGVIRAETLAHARGRSFFSSYIIVDESQNLSRHEMKTLLTRIGENSKVVLTGDVLQIDTDRLDATSNGLTYVIERFKGDTLSGHITLQKCERSTLAARAAEIL